jgi:hypothetical protein
LASAPIALDAPENGTSAAPLIAYDPSTGTTYVAWDDPINPAVDLCILPAGATVCEGGTPVLLEDSLFTGDNFPGPGGLVVLPGGEVAVIGKTGNEGSIAWISPAGGAGFLSKGQGLQNGGEPISPVDLYYVAGNAVALSSTDVALLDDDGDYFADTSLTSLSPAISKPNSNQTVPENEFPGKALETAGPEIAAESAPPPAAAGTDVVVGVGENSNGPADVLPGCINKEGTGFGVSVGKVDGTSKAAGTLNAEGLPGYGVLACSAESPVLAQGGADGVGLIEQEGDGFDGTGSLYTLDYRPFVATVTGGSFGAPVQVADVSHVSLGGAGTGPQVFLQPINYAALYAADNPPPSVKPAAPTPPPPTPNSNYTIESIVGNSNGTVTITFVPTQSGEATLVVTVPTATIASASAVDAKSKKCKKGQVKIKGKCLPSTTSAGKTSAAGTAGVPLKLTVNLSSKLKALLKKGKTVHLTATLTYVSSLGGAPTVHTYNLTVKGHKPKHKK